MAQDPGTWVSEHGEIQAALCAACQAPRQAQRGASGGVSDPPLRLVA
jgi:hypothetical protein